MLFRFKCLTFTVDSVDSLTMDGNFASEFFDVIHFLVLKYRIKHMKIASVSCNLLVSR